MRCSMGGILFAEPAYAIDDVWRTFLLTSFADAFLSFDLPHYLIDQCKCIYCIIATERELK